MWKDPEKINKRINPIGVEITIKPNNTIQMLLSGNEAISNQDVELGDAAAKYKGQCWSVVLLKSVWKKIRVLLLDRAIPIDNFSVSKKRSPIYSKDLGKYL